MKQFFTLLIASLMLLGASAETLTVATGTKYNHYVPINSMWYDEVGTQSQLIYPADMLADMVGGTITEMRFLTDAWGCYMDYGELTFSLAETELANFDNATDFISDGLTIVGTASMQRRVQQQVEIVLTFNTPYEYKGGNLLFDGIVTVAGRYGLTDCLGIETENAQGAAMIYDKFTPVNFLPQTTFTYEPGDEPTPGPTPDAPLITWLAEDGVLTITATGDGFVALTVGEATRTGDGIAVYTTTYDPAEGITVEAKACIMVDGLPVSDYTEITITVDPETPIGPDPEDPYATDYWLMIIDKDGNPRPYHLELGTNGDYTTTVAFEYPIFGGFDPETEERPNVPFYFIVNGVRYGADEALRLAVLGTALSNPLFDSDECYVLPVGYNYNLGIAFSPSREEMYVYAAQAGYTGVNEMNSAKSITNVRYFNIMGQEMTQAQGLTIMVTTYSDGTTSTVKVMK